MVKRKLEIIITTLSDVIGIKFGEDKCAFLHIEKGIIKKSSPLNINHLTIQPVADGDSYKYLGIDENIICNRPLNGEKVSKEYLNRARKIWSSELSNFKLLHATASQYLLQLQLLEELIGQLTKLDKLTSIQ